MKYAIFCLFVIGMWCSTALSAESMDARTERRLKDLKEKIESQPPLSRAGIRAYVTSIDIAIKRHLIFPRGSGGKRCTASVTQDKSGNVIDLELLQCEHGQLASAVQAAVQAASPLPLPSDKTYFSRKLQLVFVVPDGK
jgi:hypothetical protein